MKLRLTVEDEGAEEEERWRKTGITLKVQHMSLRRVKRFITLQSLFSQHHNL